MGNSWWGVGGGEMFGGRQPPAALQLRNTDYSDPADLDTALFESHALPDQGGYRWEPSPDQIPAI